MITLPALVKVDRGDHEGLLQILLRDDQSWKEAQEFAKQFISKYEMNLIRKIDGPDAWLWHVTCQGSTFIFSYDDFPCETVIFADTKNDEVALKALFTAITQERI